MYGGDLHEFDFLNLILTVEIHRSKEVFSKFSNTYFGAIAQSYFVREFKRPMPWMNISSLHAWE